MSFLRVMLVVVFCAGLLAAARPAAADDAPSRKTEARQHYEAGLRFYNVGEFVHALAEFKEAYLAYDDPAFLYNIGQCHRLLGNKADAITYYTRYLHARPDSPEQGEVKKLIAELKAQPGATPAPAANTLVGAEPVPAGPSSPPPLSTTPPLPPTQAGSAPPPTPTAATVAPSTSAPAPAAAPALAQAPAPSPEVPPPSFSLAAAPAPGDSGGQTSARARYRVAALTTAAVGLVAAGVGGLLWLSADGAYQDCQKKGGCLRAEEPRGEDTAGVVLFWGGSALAVVGGTAFVLLRARPGGALAWLGHVAVDPGRGLSFRGAF